MNQFLFHFLSIFLLLLLFSPSSCFLYFFACERHLWIFYNHIWAIWCTSILFSLLRPSDISHWRVLKPPPSRVLCLLFILQFLLLQVSFPWFQVLIPLHFLLLFLLISSYSLPFYSSSLSFVIRLISDYRLDWGWKGWERIKEGRPRRFFPSILISFLHK